MNLSLIQELTAVRGAQKLLATKSDEEISDLICSVSKKLIEHSDVVLSANAQDLSAMAVEDPRYDRLKLTEERLHGIAKDLTAVAQLPSPLNIVLEARDLKNGIHLEKISVPIGVVCVIYEARPNVTLDVFALCMKSGNACVLKGGSDAHHSNEAIANLIHAAMAEHKFDPALCMLAPHEREKIREIVEAVGLIDLVIPRGSQKLIEFVREHSRVPVIETGAGICHTYVDASADTPMAARIVENAKTKRPSVCNALDCLLIHKLKIPDVREIVQPLALHRVVIHADELSYQALSGYYPNELLQTAKPEDVGHEWLSLNLTIKTVASLDEALEHITKYSSRHSEAIISADKKNIERFLREVDAAAVYANASTYFTDGAQFGLGAEIGISTQKMHARGPMGLRELTTYKYILRGSGQVRM